MTTRKFIPDHEIFVSYLKGGETVIETIPVIRDGHGLFNRDEWFATDNQGETDWSLDDSQKLSWHKGDTSGYRAGATIGVMKAQDRTVALEVGRNHGEEVFKSSQAGTPEDAVISALSADGDDTYLANAFKFIGRSKGSFHPADWNHLVSVFMRSSLHTVQRLIAARETEQKASAKPITAENILVEFGKAMPGWKFSLQSTTWDNSEDAPEGTDPYVTEFRLDAKLDNGMGWLREIDSNWSPTVSVAAFRLIDKMNVEERMTPRERDSLKSLAATLWYWNKVQPKAST